MNLLSSVSLIIDVDRLKRCEAHKAHEQLAEVLCTLPKKFDEKKVNLSITDKMGVLRLDKFWKTMFERRNSMLFNEVHITGERKKLTRGN